VLAVVWAQNIFFGVIAAVVTVAGIGVVVTRNVVHAALFLVVVLAGVGASFLLMGSEFVGITQVLVYIGAIVVLFLFGIMLTRAPIGRSQLTAKSWPMGLVVAVAVAGVLSYTLIDEFGDQKLTGGQEADAGALSAGSTAAVSDSIFADYLIPFEVVSVLLLAALVGAIVLARKEG